MSKREMQLCARRLHKMRERTEELNLAEQLLERFNSNDFMSPFDSTKVKPSELLLSELAKFIHSTADSLKHI